MFSYSIEIGVKTMNLTRNLNPRSQYPEPLSVAQTINETQVKASIYHAQDKHHLTQNLKLLRQELIEKG